MLRLPSVRTVTVGALSSGNTSRGTSTITRPPTANSERPANSTSQRDSRDQAIKRFSMELLVVGVPGAVGVDVDTWRCLAQTGVLELMNPPPHDLVTIEQAREHLDPVAGALA